ncbi:MAG TPA: LmeA family phospholipid-binding protein [Solirubrobacteraceae bacterium]|nr:LmeA family phospholipid-binding protein [Solirubrobacteraceae bacterium]
MTRSRVGLIAAGVVGALVVVLVALQLILPNIAENRLRDRLSDNGTVEEVDVDSFPALELLWGRADETTIRMRDGHAGPGRFADLLVKTADTERLDATVDGARILTLRLRKLELRKRGRDIVGTATISDADLRRALPGNFDVRPVASGDGALVFEGSASILGRRLRGQVVVAARNGQVLLAPNVLFGGFLSLTVFADPRIEIRDVSAKQRPGGFTLTARSRLRE